MEEIGGCIPDESWTEEREEAARELIKLFEEQGPSTDEDVKRMEEKLDNMTLGELAEDLMEDMRFMGEEINLPKPDDKIYVEET